MTEEEIIQKFVELAAMDRPPGDPVLDLIWKNFYVPNARLIELIDELVEYAKKAKPSETERRRAGQLMEAVAVGAFKCIPKIGWDKVKNYRSASGSQYDLVVRGERLPPHFPWDKICSTLGLSSSESCMVVECKATSDKVDDAQFERMCSILAHNIEAAGIGIFFTIRGATGFPERGKPRKAALSCCLLKQLIFRIKQQKSVVVLDIHDLLELKRPGGLLELLIRKVQEISLQDGLPSLTAHTLREADIPDYLKILLEPSMDS